MNGRAKRTMRPNPKQATPSRSPVAARWACSPSSSSFAPGTSTQAPRPLKWHQSPSNSASNAAPSDGGACCHALRLTPLSRARCFVEGIAMDDRES
jgi:hypothetical protein